MSAFVRKDHGSTVDSQHHVSTQMSLERTSSGWFGLGHLTQASVTPAGAGEVLRIVGQIRSCGRGGWALVCSGADVRLAPAALA